jgi:hypothetical protein
MQAKLAPYHGRAKLERRPGYSKGKVRIAADFDELPVEVETAFRRERR